MISHIALDIGGSLIKLVYFSPDRPSWAAGSSSAAGNNGSGSSNGRSGGDATDQIGFAASGFPVWRAPLAAGRDAICSG